MNNVLRLFRDLLIDVSHIQKVPLKAPRDIGITWILNEGPRLDKELLRYLETGHSAPQLPDWLRPLGDRVICDHCDPEALRGLRQILVFGYKAETKPHEQQNNTSQEAFIDCDNSIDIFDRYFLTASSQYCFIEARKRVSRVIANIDFSNINPAHGPGAVYPPSKPSDKSKFNTIYTRIEPYYPFYEFFQATSSQLVDSGSSHKGLSTCDDIVASLTAVPKDSRGPRLISVHPKEAVWVQQGIRTKLEQAISAPDSPCSKNIKFKDQSVNAQLALKSSIDRTYCTIDLKDASDCISAELVRFLFGSHYQYLDCCRATHVRLFDGALHKLRKYAPMGNATTFPVESLVFWAVVVSGIQCHYGIDCNDVYVFGDDIVVPSEFYSVAISTLVRFGLKPNQNKCFVKGWFRESCGIDAYKGVNVTPIRIKQHEAESPTQLVSLCSMARRLRARGYLRTATAAYQIVSSSLGKVLPKSNNYSASGVYEWVNLDHWKFIEAHGPSIRWTKTHIYATEIIQLAYFNEVLRSHDWYHVLDSLLAIRPGDYSSKAEYPVPYRTRLVKGWTPVIHYVATSDGSLMQDPAYVREEVCEGPALGYLTSRQADNNSDFWLTE